MNLPVNVAWTKLRQTTPSKHLGGIRVPVPWLRRGQALKDFSAEQAIVRKCAIVEEWQFSAA